MKHLFVSYEIAKALNQLGFDEPCLGSYNDKGNFNIGSTFGITNSLIDEWIRNGVTGNYICTAPTHQQVVDWFREKHKIEVCASSYYYPKHYGIVSQIGYSHKSNTEYPESDYGEGLGKRQKHEKVIVYSERNFDDYYSALNAAIDEAIKLITK